MKDCNEPPRMNRWTSLALLSVGLVLASSNLMALDSDQDQPATLEADTFEIDLQTGQRIYRGNVLYRQGSIRLECDELITNFNDAGDLDDAVCTGDPGKFRQRPQDSEEDMFGEARVITLDQVAEIVTLKSRAEVTQGGTKLNGRLLTYNLKTEKLVVKGGASGSSGGAAASTSAGTGQSGSDSEEGAAPEKPSRPTIVIQPRNKKKAATEEDGAEEPAE